MDKIMKTSATETIEDISALIARDAAFSRIEVRPLDTLINICAVHDVHLDETYYEGDPQDWPEGGYAEYVVPMHKLLEHFAISDDYLKCNDAEYILVMRGTFVRVCEANVALEPFSEDTPVASSLAAWLHEGLPLEHLADNGDSNPARVMLFSLREPLYRHPDVCDYLRRMITTGRRWFYDIQTDHPVVAIPFHDYLLKKNLFGFEGDCNAILSHLTDFNGEWGYFYHCLEPIPAASLSLFEHIFDESYFVSKEFFAAWREIAANFPGSPLNWKFMNYFQKKLSEALDSPDLEVHEKIGSFREAENIDDFLPAHFISIAYNFSMQKNWVSALIPRPELAGAVCCNAMNGNSDLTVLPVIFNHILFHSTAPIVLGSETDPTEKDFWDLYMPVFAKPSEKFSDIDKSEFCLFTVVSDLPDIQTEGTDVPIIKTVSEDLQCYGRVVLDFPARFFREPYYCANWRHLVEAGGIATVESWLGERTSVQILPSHSREVTMRIFETDQYRSNLSCRSWSIPSADLSVYYALDPYCYLPFDPCQENGSAQLGEYVETACRYDQNLLEFIDYDFILYNPFNSASSYIQLREDSPWFACYINHELDKRKAEFLYGTVPGQTLFSDYREIQVASHEARDRRKLDMSFPLLSFADQLRSCLPNGDSLPDKVFAAAAELGKKLRSDWFRAISENGTADPNLLLQIIETVQKFAYIAPEHEGETAELLRKLASCDLWTLHRDFISWYSLLKMIVNSNVPRLVKYDAAVSLLEDIPAPFPGIQGASQKFNILLRDFLTARKFELEVESGKSKTDEIRKALEKLDETQLEETSKKLIEEQAKAEERDKVLREVSHNIKNMVVSVIDPLRQLSEEETAERRFILKLALSGAELLREIVWCINESFRISPDDFLTDVNNPGDPSMTLKELFFESLRYSVNYMLDPYAKHKYMGMFLPTRDDKIAGRADWKIAETSSQVSAFINTWMCSCTITFSPEAEKLKIGNSRGSATKLIILLNELTINVFKALAETPMKERRFSFSASIDGSRLTMELVNTYKYENSSTGYGKVIVENIVNGFQGDIENRDTGHIFNTIISLPLS